MKNTMHDLRNHLFATIEALQDPEKPMDLERARAINETAQTLIKSAKVEVDYIEVTGDDPTGTFFPKLTDGARRAGRLPQPSLPALTPTRKTQ